MSVFSHRQQVVGHAARQRVSTEVQRCQVGEAAQLRRNLPGQLVDVEPKFFQVGKVAQFGRDRPTQLVFEEGQSSDRAVTVDRDAVPLTRGASLSQFTLLVQPGPLVAW